MLIKKGRSRLVLVFPKFGVVIKFPDFHFRRIPRMIKIRFKEGGWKFFWETLKHEFNYFTMETSGSLKRELFLGLVANWNEFYLYWKTKSPFLQPTYFSFFGFLNIQKYGESCLIDPIDLWYQLLVLTDNKVFDDGHHFSNPKNFLISNGKLQMIDYGNPSVNNVVIQYGKKIFELFDPDFVREQQKNN